MRNRKKQQEEEQVIGRKTRSSLNRMLPSRILSKKKDATHKDVQDIRSSTHEEIKNDGPAKDLPLSIVQENFSKIFFMHPFIFISKGIVTISISFLLFIVLLYFHRHTADSEILDAIRWSMVVLFLLMTTLLLRFFISWRLNVALFKPEKITRISRVGVLENVIESIPFAFVKFVDIRQKGIFHTLFNCADIHITSITTEDAENEMDIVLKDVWKAKLAFDFLQAQVRINSTSS